MKYISIDIETTGLDPDKHHILEFAAVLEDTEKNITVEKLSYFQRFINEKDRVWDTDTLHFHRTHGFFERERGNEEGLLPDDLHWNFLTWLSDRGVTDINHKEKFNVAGKNYANFDHQFLRKLYGWNFVPFRRRMIDPAILYYEPGDEYLPNMATCLERAGLPTEVTHRALDDARQVIELIRRKLK